jgi:hypothetical protein
MMFIQFFAWACAYTTNEVYDSLVDENDEVGKLIGCMMANPGKFGVREE